MATRERSGSRDGLQRTSLRLIGYLLGLGFILIALALIVSLGLILTPIAALGVAASCLPIVHDVIERRRGIRFALSSRVVAGLVFFMGAIVGLPAPRENTTMGSSVTLPTPVPGDMGAKAFFAEFQLQRGSVPTAITAGPDGNVWFTEGRGNRIGYITPSGTVGEFEVPTKESDPSGIALGPDGNLWFTEQRARKIGRITPIGEIVEFSLAESFVFPVGIVAGPDGALWFGLAGPVVGRITTNGAVSSYRLPNWGPPSAPGSAFTVATGSGHLWVGDRGRFGRLSMSGEFALFAVPATRHLNSSIAAMVATTDGDVWYTDWTRNRVGRITSAETVEEFVVNPGADAYVSGVQPQDPTADSFVAGAFPRGITVGSDGNVWFSENRGNAISRITATGAIIRLSLPAPDSQPGHMTTGPDGNLWFTLKEDRIGRFDLRAYLAASEVGSR